MSQYHRYVAHSGIQLMHREVVLFMRHGLCHSNIEWPIPDYSDEKDGLTTVGVEQAKLTANWLRAHYPSERWIVVTSALTRARQTGEVVNEILGGILHKPDARINEFPGESVESYDSLDERLRAFCDEVPGKCSRSDERVLVVTHGHVLEYLVTRAVGLGRPTIVAKSEHHSGCRGLATHANCGVSAFSGPELQELVMWNSHAHLSK